MSAKKKVARTVPLVLPDTEYGLAIDENGARWWGVSCAVLDRDDAVSMVLTDAEHDVVMVALRPKELFELGAWLYAAGLRLEAAREDADVAESVSA